MFFFCSATCRQVVRAFSTQLISLSASRCQPIDDQQPSAVSLSLSLSLSSPPVILQLRHKRISILMRERKTAAKQITT
jgi:hypothetical protein